MMWRGINVFKTNISELINVLSETLRKAYYFLRKTGNKAPAFLVLI